GERLYVLTAGDAPEEDAAHATPGFLAHLSASNTRVAFTPLPLPKHSRLEAGAEPLIRSHSSNLDLTPILGGSLRQAIQRKGTPPSAKRCCSPMARLCLREAV